MKSSDIEIHVLGALETIGVPYEIVEIDPVFADTAEFCKKYGYTLESSGNTILVASKKDPRVYSACVVKGSDRLDVNKKVRKLMGVSKLSFASAEDTIAVTGMAIGGVTPFALPSSIKIYADEKLMTMDYIILGSGSRSSKVKISPQVFLKIPNVDIIPGLSL